jgi:hypothetical protein
MTNTYKGFGRQFEFVGNSPASIILGGLFYFILGFGLIAAFYLFQRQIICQEKAPNIANQCTLRTFYLVIPWNTPLGSLGSATVEETRITKGNFYSIQLRTTNGIIPLSYWNLFHPGEVASAINQYIALSSNQTFSIPRFYDWKDFLIILGLSMLIFKSIYIFCLPILTLKMNKESDSLEIKNGHILRIRELKFMLSDVKAISLQEIPPSNLYNVLKFVFGNSKPEPEPTSKPELSFQYANSFQRKKFKSIVNEEKRRKRLDFKYRLVLVFKENSSLNDLVLTPYFFADYSELKKSVDELNGFIGSN